MTQINSQKMIETSVDMSEETNTNQFTNMPAISDELYRELVKEFNNERHYFFNDSYNLED